MQARSDVHETSLKPPSMAPAGKRAGTIDHLDPSQRSVKIREVCPL
jgi:hypothetical protein